MAQCLHCIWYREGCTLQAGDGEEPAPRRPDAPACEHFATGLDCLACGACCREAYDSVPVTGEDEEVLTHHPELVVTHDDGWVDLRRVPSPSGCGTRCAALTGDGPFVCRIYAHRPTTCRELEPGSDGCLFARRRVGLSPPPHSPPSSSVV